jgi:hypothetical protein
MVEIVWEGKDTSVWEDKLMVFVESGEVEKEVLDFLVGFL